MGSQQNGVHANDVTASYKSPDEEKLISSSFKADSVNTVQSKTEYFSQLRQTTKNLQDQINSFLTSKMEQDKVEVSTNGSKLKDIEEEENYGEEKVED